MDFPITYAHFRLKQLLPAASLAVGLLVLGTRGWQAGVTGLLCWAVLCSARTGLEISADRQRSRDYWGLLGQRFGSWQSLPPVVGVTLKYYATLAANRTSATSWGVWKQNRQRYEELVLMLSLQDQPVGLIVGHYDLDDVNTAIDFAHELAEYFDVPVHQYLPPHLFEPLPPAAGRIGPGEAV